MEKCDSFWQWGNTRKVFSLTKIGSAGNSSCPVRDETSCVADGSCLNTLNKGGLLKAGKFMDSAFVPRSQMISEGNASKSGGSCRDMYLSVQCSTVEIDLFSSNCKNGQPNCSITPTTVLQVPNASPSSDTSVTDFMGPAFVPRSQMISESNASKSRGPCRDMYLPVQCSTMEIDLFNSNCKNVQPDCSISPTTVLEVPNASPSSDTSLTDFDAISCRPHGYLSPQLQFLPCCSDGNFCEPSKFRALKRDQRDATENDHGLFPVDIHNTCAGISREASMDSSPSCSESENLKLQLWGVKEEIKNLRALGASEATLSYMEKPKRNHSMIYNRSSEIWKDNSESFEALHILACMAIWVLDNSDMGEDHKAKPSSEQWGVFHPTGVPFRQKRVIRRAKNAFKSHSGLHRNADKKVAANSELLSGSLGFIQPSENQVIEGRISDKGQGAVQSVRSSKRTRSQFLSSKYCDSVLQPLKKGTRR